MADVKESFEFPSLPLESKDISLLYICSNILLTQSEA